MLALLSTLVILLSAFGNDVIASADTNTTQKKAIRYLALGDSYTIGTSLSDKRETFPVKIADKLNAAGYPCDPPKIIAENGWTTDDLLRATSNFSPDSAFDLVSLLIGVNNQYQNMDIEEYSEEFETLLLQAVSYAGDSSNVFVVSIPDYSVTAFGRENAEKIAQEINQFNKVNREITESYGISYFYITDISRSAVNDSSLIASDNLHPSGKMYELWLANFIEDIKMKLHE